MQCSCQLIFSDQRCQIVRGLYRVDIVQDICTGNIDRTFQGLAFVDTHESQKVSQQEAVALLHRDLEMVSAQIVGNTLYADVQPTLRLGKAGLLQTRAGQALQLVLIIFFLLSSLL